MPHSLILFTRIAIYKYSIKLAWVFQSKQQLKAMEFRSKFNKRSIKKNYSMNFIHVIPKLTE